MNQHPRMIRERRTIQAMIRVYCAAQHQTAQGLCPECASLQDYALARLDKCPFQEGKTTCAKCPVHCYQPAKREQVRTVMRYAGPRMITLHPILAVRHLVDGLQKEPVRPPKKRNRTIS